MCWENPTQADLVWRAVVQGSITQTWQKYSGITFTGWGACAANSKGIRIQIADVNPAVQVLGKALDGLQNGMVLDFAFIQWAPNGCTANAQARAACITSVAVHEFGHALHGLKCLSGFGKRGDASVAVGGGACRVELDSHHARCMGLPYFTRRRVVGEVERHQRLKHRA